MFISVEPGNLTNGIHFTSLHSTNQRYERQNICMCGDEFHFGMELANAFDLFNYTEFVVFLQSNKG